MQIKRFEATDMTEALRMVKREFGDDAVILSAKEIRPGGFFSALRKKSVEITAAADYPADDAKGSDDFPGMLSKHLQDDAETDRVSLSSTAQTIAPFAPKAPSLVRRPPAFDPQIIRTDRSDTDQLADRIADRATPVPAPASCRGGNEASGSPRARWMEDQHLVAEPFYRDLITPKTIAVVGPSGAGKSTSVAKLAWRCLTVEKKQVGLISLDRFRIGANAMLERVARIMNLPLSIVHDSEQLQSALNDLADVDVVLIDTPGISRMENSMMDDVCSLIRSANPDEIHLVANATVREEVVAATATAFSPFGVSRLLLTHMDEYIESPAMLQLLKKVRLPVSFHADGIDLFEGLKETTAGRLAGVSARIKPSDGQVAAFTGKQRPKTAGSVIGGGSGRSCQYVANRNSELFHHPNCKSVKRINAENITAFNSIEEAVDEGFKPCRACCNVSMITKPVPAAFGYERASAI